MLMIRRVVLLTVAFAVCGSAVLFVTSLRDDDSKTIKADFRSSLGLYKGNNVNVLGYKVGSIKDIEPRGDHVRVTFTVSDKVKIPRDAVAVIVRPGVVTDRNLELTPVYRSGPEMEDGHVIPVANTRQPVEFDQLITAIDSLAVELTGSTANGYGVSEALKSLAQSLDGNGPEIKAAIDGTAGAAAVTAENTETLVKLVDNLASLASTAKHNDQLVRSFSGNLADVTESFAEEGPEINASFAAMASSLRDVARFVTDNETLVKKDLDALVVTTETLTRRKRELTELIDVLPTTFQNLTNIVDPKTGVVRAALVFDESLSDGVSLRHLCAGVAGEVPIVCGLTAGAFP